MKETTQNFLNLFFNEGEEICFSANKYAYPSEKQENINEDTTTLVAINPIKGQRNDENVTAYRTFMVECDEMSLEKQMKYIKSMEFPYSYCCFSGGKSLHFALVLDHDIPSESIYRHTAEWILNILDQADPFTKNPSRSVRFPGSIRPESGKEQRLVHMGRRTSLDELSKWLNKHPSKAPIPMMRKPKNTGPVNIEGIKNKKWVVDSLNLGVHNMEGGRNQTWMAIACEFAMNGMGYDETVHHLSRYFDEQSDFKEKEWLDAVTNGWNYADKISLKR
jgi:hypothetical protein